MHKYTQRHALRTKVRRSSMIENAKTVCILPHILPFLLFMSIATKVVGSDLLQYAVTLQLRPCILNSYPEIEEYKKRISEKLVACEYVAALEIVVGGLEQYTKDFILQTYFAALLGDISEKYTQPLKDELVEKSKQTFNKLLTEVDQQPLRDTYRFKNEYYFRFAEYEKQYTLGKAMIADYWNSPQWSNEVGAAAYYYQGVGATYCAKKLLLEGKNKGAREYAHKALLAWAQYFSYENDFYNAYAHYALTLGILGDKEEMMRALQRGADLAKKDLLYHEFQEVIIFIDEWVNKIRIKL